MPGATGSEVPLIVGGMLAVVLGDDADAAQAIEVLAGRAFAEKLVRTGGFLSPHLAIDPDAVADPTSSRLLDLLASSDDVQFDGSDLMPGAVGTDTFWSGMRAFFGDENIATILADIDAGWTEDEPSG